MRFKTTFLLLLANVAVCYFIWSLGRPDSGPPPHAIVPPTPSVEAIAVEGGSLARPLRLEAARDGQWRMVSPVDWLANPHAVNAILTQLQLLSKEINFSVRQIEDSGRSLADYGLENPSLTLTVTAGGEPYVLKIGALTQIGGRVYILSPDGQNIIAAPQELLQLLSLDAEQLRSKKIFSLPPFEVRGISVRGPADDMASPDAALAGQRIGIVKSGSQWRIETPIQARADNKAVEAELTLLTALEANRFVLADDASPAAYGLTTPTLRVSLEGNTRQTLLLGRPVPRVKQAQYYAQLEGNPAVFTVDAEPFEVLRQAQVRLRERHVLSFDPAQLSAIEVQGQAASDRVRLQRLENGAWQVLAADNVDPVAADGEHLISLIKNLLELQATQFVTDAPSAENLASYGLNHPVRTVVLNFGANTPALTLSLGKPAADKSGAVYASVSGSKSVYQTHPAILDELSTAPLDYRSRLLMHLPESARVGKCVLTDLSDNKVVFEGDPAQADALPEAKKAALLSLANILRAFQAARYVSDSFSAQDCAFEGKKLPWRYRLTAEISLPSGTDKPKVETVEYLFTARQGGTVQLGGNAHAKVTFLLPQPLIDALFALTDTAPEIQSVP